MCVCVLSHFKTNRFNESSVCNIEDFNEEVVNPKISVTISFATHTKKIPSEMHRKIKKKRNAFLGLSLFRVKYDTVLLVS